MTTLLIDEVHLNAAVDQYLHSLSMIPDDETVIEVAVESGGSRIYVTTKKE